MISKIIMYEIERYELLSKKDNFRIVKLIDQNIFIQLGVLINKSDILHVCNIV